jgi:hypothetical protein
MNTKRASSLCFGLILAFCLTPAGAQVTGGFSTTSPPAATTPPAPRHVATPPAGLHALKVGDRTFFCEPAEDDWIKQAVAIIKPPARPTTMPSDMISNITQRGPEVAKEILTDFAATDAKPVNDILNGKLTDQLKKLDTLKPVICYMPVSRTKLNNVLKAGWTDPRYRYVPVADQFTYATDIKLSLDAPMDDQVIWMEIADAQTADDKKTKLVSTVQDFENRYADGESLLSQVDTRSALVSFLNTQYMEPLKLPVSAQWFGNAVAEVYSLKYTSVLSGVPRLQMTVGLLRDDPHNPLQPMAINLLNPMDTSVLRPEVVPLYNQAAVRKGSAIVVNWITQNGDGVLAKTLPSMRAIPLTDPADLAKRIKDATGFDATKLMVPLQ